MTLESEEEYIHWVCASTVSAQLDPTIDWYPSNSKAGKRFSPEF